jgi:hypothetical protein
MPTTQEKPPVLAPADKLKREVQAALTDDLTAPRYQDGIGRFDGHSYVAAEAYWHLAGGRESGLQPMQLKRDGVSHWWLRDGKGRVIDLTLARGEKSSFPYQDGTPRSFRYTPKGMSNRAATVAERVEGARAE